MMGNRLLTGICVRNGLWDEWEGIDGGFHPSTHHDRSMKVNDFKASSFTEPTHSTA
jgi:hypothetical protein